MATAGVDDPAHATVGWSGHTARSNGSRARAHCRARSRAAAGAAARHPTADHR